MSQQGVQGSVLDYANEPRNIGWRVTMAGLGINLALGVLYAWSMVKKYVPADWKWSDSDKTLPYSVACLVFAFMMVPAGRAQDRIGPRWVAFAGGLTVGLGLIFASFTTSVWVFVLGFGVLAGAGIGMGYAAATPAAVKWFPPQRTGLIAGLVVAGFGLASVYIAPLAEYLINHFSVNKNTGPGVQMTLLILGIAFIVVVSVLSQLLAVPPAGWKPAAPSAASKAAKPSTDYTCMEMLRTPQFYLMWVMYAFGAGAGLMIIASLAKIVEIQAHGFKGGFMLVAVLAIGNAGGRIIAGMMSDKIGRRNTMLIAFVFQAILMFALAFASQVWALVIMSVLIGANYGANLALFPAATKDYFGLKNFGVNYGWVFTAWGVGGFVLAQISAKVFDAAKAADKARLMAGGMAESLAAKAAAGNYNLAYVIAGVCLLAAAVISLVMKPVGPKAEMKAAAPAEAVGTAR